MKSKLPPYLKSLLYTLLLSFISISTYANHLVGMDLYYTWISGNTYKITLVAYADCGAALTSGAYATLPTNSPAIYIYNGDSYITTILLAVQPPTAGVEITPVCPADISLTQCTDPTFTIPGIKKFVYSSTYTLPTTSANWRFLFTGDMTGTGTSIAGRALSITNISSTPDTYIQLIDTLNNTTAHNSNPTLTNVPTPFFCLNNNDNYNPGAVDADGDSLMFFLVDGQNGTVSTSPGGLVTYIPPYSATAPLAVTTMSFDHTTGQIVFYPDALQRSLVVYNVEEYRDGSFIGTCQREMTFLVQTCSNTPPTGILSGAVNGIIDDSTHFHVCANSGPFSVHINPTEATVTNLITVTATGLPTGATFVTTGNGTTAPHSTFTWTSTGVAPGTYIFYVTYSDNNCPLSGTQTIAYTITVKSPPTLNYALISAATCIKKAAINIEPGGPGIPWIIDVSHAASPFDTIQVYPTTVSNFTDSLWPGSYIVTIYSAAHACKFDTTLSVAPPIPMSPTVTFTNPSYCGNNDGTIKLYHLNPGALDTIKFTYNGVVQTPQVHLVAADSTVSLTGLLAGVYSNIYVTYGICVSLSAGPVTLVNPPFTMSAISYTNPVYCGICNGTITLYGLHPGQLDTLNYTKGGVTQTPYVHIIGSDSTMTLTGLCTGTYANFIAKTAGVCVSPTLGPVTLTAPFTMRAISYTNPDYCGICNGVIKLYGLYPGQLDTITFTKDGVPQTPVVATIGADSMVTITGLCAGTYAGFIAHTGGVCASNTLGPVTLTVPAFTMRAITFTNPDYCGVCNGTIELFGLHPGQTDTITYTKDGVAQTPVVQFIGTDSTVTITGLCAGTYDNFIAHTGGVCVSNTLGPVTLAVPPFTMSYITFTNPDFCGICNGTVTLHGLHPGETDTITYTKDGVAQTPFVHVIGADSTVLITSLCAGVYNNFVAHTGGACVSNTLGPVTLSVPPFTMSYITFTNPDFCGICNGTIILHGLHPGQTDTITYTKDGVAQTPVVHVIGTDSTVTLTGLCFGVYNNFIAHTGGVCVSNTLGPVTLTVPPFTIRTSSFTNPVFCGICSGTITLYGLHPGQLDTITYTKDGVAQTPVVQLIGADSMVTLTGLCAGLYDNFIAHTGGVCVSNSIGPIDLTVPPFTMRAITFTNPDFCGICNGTITLYGLHPGQLDTITYTKDGVVQTPVIQLIGPDSTVSLTGLCFGMYDNFIAHTGGVCVSNSLGPADLTVPPFTVRALDYYNPTKCGFCDGYITLYGLHPGQQDTVTYTFNGVAQTPISYFITADSTIIISGLCEGTYDNFVVHTGGVCVSNVLGPVTLVAPPIVAGFSIFLMKSCSGDTLKLTNTSAPASDLTYQWSFGDGTTSTATNPVHVYTLPGTYQIKLVITNTRCFDSSIQNITIDNLVKAGFTDIPDSFVCMNKPVAFTNTSQGTLLTYNWNFGDGDTSTATNPTYTYEHTGTYTITLVATNYVPCTDMARRIMTVDSASAISVAVTDSVICQGHMVTLTGVYSALGNRGVLWVFSDGITTQNENPVSHTFSTAGTYTVTVEAFYRACPDTTATRSILVFTYPQLSLGPDTSICPGSNPIPLSDPSYNGSSVATWLWSTGETTQGINIVAPGYYYATVTVDGCSASDTVWVKNDCYMDIPNAFTPNGDGVNDYFYPRDELAKGLTTFTMQIYNRWGQLIFETNNIDGRGWDGKFNGVAQPEGVFIYKIDATFKDGQIEHHQGNVTLLR